MSQAYDVVVVGSGPNGLAAAIVAARAGLHTVIIEAAEKIGGGTRSAELTLPGFSHDVCSAVHPMAVASPFFRSLPLGQHGLDWITPSAAAAHPLDHGDAAVMYNDLAQTAGELGEDAAAYRRTVGSVAEAWPRLESDLLGPLGRPHHPLAFAAFGLKGIWPAASLVRRSFRSERARALFAGCAAHSILPFEAWGGAAFGLTLAAVGHCHGWPVPRGGSGTIAAALVDYFRSLGGEVVTGWKVESAAQLPAARAILFDTSPATLARVMAERLPARFRARLQRYAYGPGVFKVDWALREPIPWRNRACALAATAHVGGTFEEIAAAEAKVERGEIEERPFVLLTQPSLFDASRAPSGRHTAWGYCHVPNGSSVDMTERIEAQVERFAPGFRDVILARHTRSPAQLEQENANLVGGDVGGGSNRFMNLFLRPTWRHYTTPDPGVYLCSSATPPGAGVHGMCGYRAAQRMLARRFGMRPWHRYPDPRRLILR